MILTVLYAVFFLQRRVNAVAEWLNVSVGIPNPRANEIAEVLEGNGFDSIEHMVCIFVLKNKINSVF